MNVISAGPLRSRAARAIGADATKSVNFIDTMIDYSKANAPLKDKDLEAEEIGQTAAFLSSDLSSAITGVTLYVDNGLHAMGIAVDSQAFAPEECSTECVASK